MDLRDRSFEISRISDNDFDITFKERSFIWRGDSFDYIISNGSIGSIAK